MALADYNEAPVAKKYADKYYRVSTLDIDAIKAVAIEEKVDFLITVCTDQALHTVAKVSEDLGLPCYIDYRTALNVTNKEYMKTVFWQHGIPTAKFVIMREFEEEKISGMRYPLIVKPVDCNSSKGVRKCQNLEELKRFFADAVAFSRTNTAAVEEFVEGDEVTIDVYVENGKAKVLSVSNSDKIKGNDKFVIFRTIWPAAVNESVKRKIEDAAQKIADAFAIKNSPMLIQCLTDGENLYVIEFSARTGGGVKYLLIKRASGFDVVSAVVDLTLGKFPKLDQITAEQSYMINDFIYCKPGVFDHLEGFEELKAEGYLKDYYLFKWKGAEFDSINASGDRVAGYTVTGNTPEEVIAKQKVVRNRIRVVSSTGENMARTDLLVDLESKDGFLYSKLSAK